MKKQKAIKCPLCFHEMGFRKNSVSLEKWLCTCDCHKHEVKKKS